MGCPGGARARSDILAKYLRVRFRQIFPIKRLQWEKKDIYAMLGCNNDRLFPEKSFEVLFLPKKRA